MPKRVFSLESVRTDGWFERIGEGIGSFQALCEIVGERFFAFSIIAGARITALTVDRRNPDQTQVDFVVGAESDVDLEPQRLSLADFRRRLVGALLVDEAHDAPVPSRETDVEAVQLYIGARYLLLAPLYGYSLKSLMLEDASDPRVALLHDGSEESYTIDAFRVRLRAHIREELDRAATGSRSAIDLAKVTEAEAFASRGEWAKVIGLLGSWPAPLAIFLRTPEGQAMQPDARGLVARGLGLLGTACEKLGEIDQAEEVFRIGIQYAPDGLPGADLFCRLGVALMKAERGGEAIGAFRRALALGGAPGEVYPLLGRAFISRTKYVAAYGCFREAMSSGIAEADLIADLRLLESKLGRALTAWKAARV